MQWGLLGSESIGQQRRVRTLELGAAVRAFNDKAVPGMGNVFFGKQIILALLGVSVAEELRTGGMDVSNIETANAIEAIACLMAYQEREWAKDPYGRLRGRLKLRTVCDHTFQSAKQRSYYVTQPMRMVTIQPLIELGLVEGGSMRFNAYRCSKRGQDLIQLFTEEHGVSFGKSDNIKDHLVRWGKGRTNNIWGRALPKALSPTIPLSVCVRDQLRAIIISGNDRRLNIMKWMASLGSDMKWSKRPSIIDESHWTDLKSGSLFFEANDLAHRLLIRLECDVDSTKDRRLDVNEFTKNLQNYTEAKQLVRASQRFLELGVDPTPDGVAKTFCHECLEFKSMLRGLVRRDGRVLKLVDGWIKPGHAFKGAKAASLNLLDDSGEVETIEVSHLNKHISRRVVNMYCMHQDLSGSWELEGEHE